MFNEYYEFQNDGEIIDVYVSDVVTVWGIGFVKDFNLKEKQRVLNEFYKQGWELINKIIK